MGLNYVMLPSVKKLLKSGGNCYTPALYSLRNKQLYYRDREYNSISRMKWKQELYSLGANTRRTAVVNLDFCFLRHSGGL